MALMANSEFSEKYGEPDEEEMMDMVFTRRRCCFWRPFYMSERSTAAGSVWWERIGTAENEENWWIRGWKKLREWSEIIAGPRWKTFIRRFNKNRGGGGRHGQFEYDALSYALNFDEGRGQSGHLDDDYGHRHFSSRYASIPLSIKSSRDLGREGSVFI